MGVEFTALDIMGYHLVPLSGDANGDGIVNATGFGPRLDSWLATGSNPADVNHDGIVNSQDIALISSNWLGTYGSVGSGGPATADGTSQGLSCPSRALRFWQSSPRRCSRLAQIAGCAFRVVQQP